ncbi:MAG: preprotein translocase subunit SecG [Acidobacteria bacterium 13_1_20CM_3_53_8]|nr:MAG: preprotein translocase subunit SecG [Acidobacteria bacterium 13_1_20CM_3_53_8]
MLIYILYGLFILACITLVGAVLLQPGKADAGSLFTSSISSTAFGPRGTQTILAKITIGAAAAFMLVALTISLPGISGSRSVLQSTHPDTQSSPQASPSPAASPAATTAQEATANATESNANASNTSSQPTNVNAATPQSSPARRR